MEGDFQFTIDEAKDGSKTFKWHRKNMKPDDNDYEQFLAFMHRQIRRLRRIRNQSKFNPNIEKIPKSQLETLWSFLEANIVAINMAIKNVEEEFVKKGDDEEDIEDNSAVQINGSHYDVLGEEYDDLDYSSPSCDNKDIMDFEMYDVTEELKTNYQQLNFAINPDNEDICMDIEDIIQICSCYRPQYHEYVVHAAARFVDEVKRVIFIGGGDSMILHEALKYPNLELVVGLELDQTVVRKGKCSI